MILTGKAKDDFDRWDNNIHGIINTERHSIPILFDDLNPLLKYTLIIDWLDEVGIYIGLTRFNLGEGYFEWRVHYSNYHGQEYTRHEATEQAIKHANEIYNESKTIKKD